MSEPAEPAQDAAGPVDPAAAMDLLRAGELEVEGRMIDASNATLYCTVSTDLAIEHCIYKPIRGERPLWDFPDGTLANREVAAYAVSDATRWDIVPPTVLRDGPYGPGMVQLWVDTDPEVDLAELVRSDRPDLRQIALFDVVVNNADRKGGHLLPTAAGEVHGIDHGLCFHTQNKLRTLLWTWRGRRLHDPEIDRLSELRAQLEGSLGDQLSELLTRAEVRAVTRRLDGLLTACRFPNPSGDWPALPWPPF